MSSMTVDGALGGLDAALEMLGTVDFDDLSVPALLGAAERIETACRRAAAISHTLAAAVGRRDREELGAPADRALADVVRLTPADARRRLRDAGQLGPRTSLTGQPLAPELPATAKAWEAGILDPGHLRVIQRFVRELPQHLPVAEIERAEAFLAEQAAVLRPDQLQKAADRLALRLNPDGVFSDADRARQRGFTWSPQRADGMSIGKLLATPELRSMVDAWFAKFAAPGMCNPDDQVPTVTGEPAADVSDRDARSHRQRQHDALVALVRGQLGDPNLGQHRGLPVTVIVSTNLEQMQTGAGHGVTAGGTLLPMRDVIRMASHAWHYLCVFDRHTERAIYLGRSKRIASADQRIVLHAKDRGCSAPGCDMPGYLSEVHHVHGWSDGGLTNVDELTFACGSDHRLIAPGGWRTRKRRDGTTEWIPPPQLGLKPGVNTYHHPERLLPPDDDAV